MITEKHPTAVILAAGEGTRMKSRMAKVLHQVCGKSMIRHVVGAVKEAGFEKIIVVIGHQAEAVRADLDGEGVLFALQEERLGTGHAVMQAGSLLDRYEGTVMILAGDTPLLRSETLRKFYEFHRREKVSATVMSAVMENADGYGRVIRDGGGDLLGIIEHGDATEEQRGIKEINSGLFCFESADLFSALNRVDRRNVQGEYYLTDVMAILRKEGKRIAVYRCATNTEVLGINDCDQLEAARRLMRENG